MYHLEKGKVNTLHHLRVATIYRTRSRTSLAPSYWKQNHQVIKRITAALGIRLCFSSSVIWDRVDMRHGKNLDKHGARIACQGNTLQQGRRFLIIFNNKM